MEELKEASHNLMLNTCIMYNHLISLHCTVIYLEIPLSNFKVTTKDDYDIVGVVFFLSALESWFLAAKKEL